MKLFRPVLVSLFLMIVFLFAGSVYILGDNAEELQVMLHHHKDIMPVEGAVPQWFVGSVGLPETASGDEAHQIAHINLALWHTAKALLVLFVVLGGFFIGLAMWMSGTLLRPLRKVVEQAENSSRGQFVIHDDLPKVVELHEIAKAVNGLVYKMKTLHKDEGDAQRRMGLILQDDRETHLKNRDYFMITLRKVLSPESRYSNGFIVALRLNDPERVRNEQGASVLIKELTYLSDVARMVANKVEDGVACRVREYDIMMILPSVNETEMAQLLDEFHFKCTVEGYSVSTAAILYSVGQSVGDVLSNADYALMQAEVTPSDTPQIYKPGENNVPSWGQEKWRKYILDAFKNDQFITFFQPVMARGGGIVQKELLLRLRVGNKLLSASAFLPVINHLGYQNKLDRYMLEVMSTHYYSTEVAVNVSEVFTGQSSTVHWLMARRDQWAAADLKVAFEVSHADVLDDIETAVAFSRLVQNLGYRFGIDHFTGEGIDPAHLVQIKPGYLKVDAARLLSVKEQGGDFAEAFDLFAFVKKHGIDLIATGVDSKETADKLYTMGITMLQGFWVGEPHEEKATAPSA